jgi:hypothetical protein
VAKAEPLVGEFRIDGLDEVTRDLKKIDSSIGDLASANQGLFRSFSDLSSGLNVVTGLFRSALQMVGEVKDAIVDLGKEWERQAGIINRFSGDISNASSRINGLVTDLDLMAAQSRLSAAGLELTSEEFGTIAVRASEFAAATGGDAVQALDQLSMALISGEAEGFRRFGIAVDGVTDKSEKQRLAIDQLQAEWGEATSEADTFAGQIGTLGNRFENLKTEYLETIEQTGILDQQFDSLMETIGDLIDDVGIFGDDAGPLSDVQKFAVSSAAFIGAMIAKIEDGVQAYGRLRQIFAEVSRGNLGALGDIGQVGTLLEGAESFGETFARLAAEGTRNALRSEMEFFVREEPPRPKGKGRPEDEFDVSDLMELELRTLNEQIAAEEEILRIEEERARLADELIRVRASGADTHREEIDRERHLLDLAELRADGPAQRAAIDARRDELDLQIQLEAIEQRRRELGIEIQQAVLDGADAQAEALRAQRDLLDVEGERLEVAAKRRDELRLERMEIDRQKKENEAIMERFKEGGEQFGQLMGSSIDLLLSGQEDLGKSFVEMLDQWLKTFAIQQAMLGAAALAQAIGLAFTAPQDAAAKVVSAAKHFALAAAAGGASAAIPSGGGGSPGAAAAGPRRAPEGGGGGGDGTYVINFNSPTAEPLIGRQQERARRAAERRFGRG